MELQKKIRELDFTQSTLKKANKSLKDFAKIVSHDMKTPLANISLVTRSVELSLRQNPNKSTVEYFELINRSVRELLSFIDEILVQSDVISRNSTLPDFTDSMSVICRVLDLLAPTPDVQIASTGHFPEVQVDKTSLQQVFQNLISNAIKYNDKEEAIIKISSESNTSFHYFIVADNGIGIEDKYLDKIFEEGKILDKTDRFGGKGTGLGLAELSKNLIKSNGGNISVSSAINSGTTFRFSIPRIFSKLPAA